jgi:hypothetical protein
MKKVLKISITFAFLLAVLFSFTGCSLFNNANTEEERYAITVAGSIGGTVTGGNLYNAGDTVNATATPNDGYVFWKWVVASQVVSTNPNYSFTANDNISVVAFFLLEDQSHLQGVYYLQQSLYAGYRLFNPSDEIKRYTLNEDNTYVIEAFETQTGTWIAEENGNYINDNGVNVTFVNAEQEETKLTYDILENGEIDFHYVEIDGLDQRTIYNVLVPWPETAFRIEHTYTLIGGVENDASIIIDEEEPEVFQINIDGTFTWSYYVEGALETKTGTYKVIGNSILLNEQDITYSIYEIVFETQANVEHSRMTFQKRQQNGLTYESRIFEFDYLS